METEEPLEVAAAFLPAAATRGRHSAMTRMSRTKLILIFSRLLSDIEGVTFSNVFLSFPVFRWLITAICEHFFKLFVTATKISSSSESLHTFRTLKIEYSII